MSFRFWIFWLASLLLDFWCSLQRYLDEIRTFIWCTNQNFADTDIAEIVIDNLNKIPIENIDASLAILKHACNFQTFQHKVVGKLNF